MRLPKQNYFREVPEGLEPIPIAIVGRPNVGKSTLFNRLQSGTRKKKSPVPRNAVVSPMAGTTRDRKDAPAVFGGLLLRVIDTGGLEAEDAVKESSLLASMQEHCWRAVAEAEAVLFVIDAREGVTPLDMHIARMLRGGAGNAPIYRSALRPDRDEGWQVPIILVANKAEGAFIGPYLNDCYELEAGDPIVISAYHNEGMEELYDRLCVEIGHLQPGEGEGEGDEDDEDLQEDEALTDASEDEEATPAPEHNLKWLPPTQLTEDQKRTLRWYATHPADPLGSLDTGLKASVLHKEKTEVGKYWLDAPKKSLPDKATRDFVMKFRRLQAVEQPLKLAVIGMPNSGKSSLINALLQEERCIVDQTWGTTMDAIVSDWSFKDQPMKLIDTCGIYKGWQYPGTFSDLLEPGMGTRKAIRRAHVVVLCIDAYRYRHMMMCSTPTKFEVRLGNFVVEEGKALIIAVNKWDLIDEEEQPKYREEILDRIKDKFSDVKGVPVVFMSARYNLNLATLATRSLALYKRWSARLPTSRINNWLQAWMIRWPPPWRHGQKCSVKYMTQTRARPPTFVMWTNVTSKEMPNNYLRQIKNAMREEFRISGVPLHMVVRSTVMPKPGRKLSKKDVLKWKRVGPKQAEKVSNLNSKKLPRLQRQID